MPSPGRCSAGCTSTRPATASCRTPRSRREMGTGARVWPRGPSRSNPRTWSRSRRSRRSSIHLGNFDESERIQRQALALNPNDPDTLAQLGWRLAIRGRWDEGLAYIERAIARTVNPPGWYYDLMTIHLYLEGRYREMLASAEHSAAGDPRESPSSPSPTALSATTRRRRQALAKMASRRRFCPRPRRRLAPLPAAREHRRRADRRPAQGRVEGAWCRGTGELIEAHQRARRRSSRQSVPRGELCRAQWLPRYQ